MEQRLKLKKKKKEKIMSDSETITVEIVLITVKDSKISVPEKETLLKLLTKLPCLR
jgi:hypothetical protein